MRHRGRDFREARRAACAWLLPVLLAAAPGCGKNDPAPASPAPAAAAAGPKFENRAREAGLDFHMTFLATEQGATFKINLYDHGAGIALGDIDGDGDDDLYFSNQLGANALYRNNGDGTFTDVTEASGPLALGDRISVCAVFNDIDNDGDQDLFVVTTRGGNVLFRNEGGGRFVDVTEKAGLTWVGHSQHATFFDADDDGDLDLLIANTAEWTTSVFYPRERYYGGVTTLWELVDCPVEHDVYFRNNGDGTFTNATDEAGLAGKGWGGDPAIFDYDDDGDLDVFVGNMFGQASLYRNDGHGRFVEVTSEVLGKTPWGTVGAKAFDYDNDGDLDLMVVDMHSDMWIPPGRKLENIDEKRKYPSFFGAHEQDPGFPSMEESQFLEKIAIDYDRVFHGNALYRNLGNGKFEEVSDAAGVETFWPWSIAAGDYDNDGFIDAFIASGMGFPWGYWRCAFLWNRGDGTFEECSGRVGVHPPPGGPNLPIQIARRDAGRSSRSGAVGDLDGDGRLDLVVNNFNDHPYFYVNRSPRRNYIAFRLEGRRGNRDAVGALVRLQLGDQRMVRQVHAAGGYLAQSSKTVHFGLGDAEAVDRCEIRWPGGRVQVIEGPAVNQVHRIVEPED